MTTEDVQTNIRLPVELKNALTTAAARNNRSLSAEVTFRLAKSFENDPWVLHDGERSEMKREALSLELMRESNLATIALLREAHAMKVARLKSGDSSGHPDDLERFVQEEEQTLADIERAQLTLRKIEGRLSEIETDLELPDAHEMFKVQTRAKPA